MSNHTKPTHADMIELAKSMLGGKVRGIDTRRIGPDRWKTTMFIAGRSEPTVVHTIEDAMAELRRLESPTETLRMIEGQVAWAQTEDDRSWEGVLMASRSCTLAVLYRHSGRDTCPAMALRMIGSFMCTRHVEGRPERMLTDQRPRYGGVPLSYSIPMGATLRDEETGEMAPDWAAPFVEALERSFAMHMQNRHQHGIVAPPVRWWHFWRWFR